MEKEQIRKRAKQRYRRLRFTDDFMFGKVLVNNPEICRRLLELLLQVKIKHISFPEQQKVIDILSDGRGIRLDVYVDDENGTVYNIEMQAILRKNLPKRSRYYQGMIDMNLIERGARFNDLKQSFVIFICLKDPFGRNLPVYRFENICIQDKSLFLKDDAVKVFINGAADTAELSEDMASFLNYLKGTVTENELVQMIETEVEKARKQEGWEVEYMTLYMRDMEKREEGIEIGMQQGMERGMERGLSAMITLLKGVPLEEVCERIRASEEAYQNISIQDIRPIYERVNAE